MITTKRYEKTGVEADNIDDTMFFGQEKSNPVDNDLRVLESVCVQHEIDHLNGMTIMDRQMINTIINTEKFGRNEKVMITDGEVSVEMKYKKAKPHIDSGKWELNEGGQITEMKKVKTKKTKKVGKK